MSSRDGDWGRPMNPQSVLFPAAPGEAELEHARPYQHAHRPARGEDAPLLRPVREVTRDVLAGAYGKGHITHAEALAWLINSGLTEAEARVRLAAE